MKTELERMLDTAEIVQDAIMALKDGSETNKEHVATLWVAFCEEYDPYTEHSTIDETIDLLTDSIDDCVIAINQTITDIQEMIEMEA